VFGVELIELSPTNRPGFHPSLGYVAQYIDEMGKKLDKIDEQKDSSLYVK